MASGASRCIANAVCRFFAAGRVVVLSKSTDVTLLKKEEPP
jgi:hypothetical protein